MYQQNAQPNDIQALDHFVMRCASFCSQWITRLGINSAIALAPGVLIRWSNSEDIVYRQTESYRCGAQVLCQIGVPGQM